MVGLSGTLEREAIAPNLFGMFEDMLLAVEQHPPIKAVFLVELYSSS